VAGDPAMPFEGSAPASLPAATDGTVGWVRGGPWSSCWGIPGPGNRWRGGKGGWCGHTTPQGDGPWSAGRRRPRVVGSRVRWSGISPISPRNSRAGNSAWSFPENFGASGSVARGAAPRSGDRAAGWRGACGMGRIGGGAPCRRKTGRASLRRRYRRVGAGGAASPQPHRGPGVLPGPYRFW